jgi:hypothetical protein
MVHPSQESDPLSRIRVGMSVFDVNGRHIGTVDLVVPGEVAVGEGGPIVDRDRPPPKGVEPGEMERLRRAGYIRVDSPVLHGTERYVQRDHVGTVSTEGVQLKHPTDNLG